MAKKRFHGEVQDGPYAGPVARELEHMDGGMISEDHSKMANMPTEVVMKFYPKMRYSTYDLDDTIHGIDAQQSADSKADVRRNGMRDGQQ